MFGISEKTLEEFMRLMGRLNEIAEELRRVRQTQAEILLLLQERLPEKESSEDDGE